MHVVTSVLNGFGMRDLSQGKRTLEQTNQKQFKRSVDSNFCCMKCGSRLSAPTLHTADAGQAFEVIKPHRIDRAFRMIFKLVRISCRREDPTVSCMHTPKSKTRFGGWIRDRLKDRSVFYLSKVEHCMRGLAKFRWYIFGDKFLYQKEGIPIGGPVSGAILEGVLSVDEHVFEQFGWKVFADSLGIRGTREQWLSLARYVDDVFAHSFWFCPECVEYIITLIYKQTVNFDKACEVTSHI